MCKYLVVISFVFLLVGCRRGEEQEPTTPEQADAEEGEPAAATGLVTITAALQEGDQVAITVANGTEGEVGFRRGLLIEQLDGEEWVELVAIGDVWIRSSCTAIDGVLFPEGLEEQCFRLPALTQLDVMPWLGTFGDAQCACEECALVPAGRYRVVARDCDGERYESEPIAIRLQEE